MTKNEFIQEAALRLLTSNPEMTAAQTATEAVLLADEVWTRSGMVVQESGRSEEADILDTLDDHPIGELATEVARIEGEQISAKNERARKNGSRRMYQISGADVRLQNVCSYEDIKTVGDLLKIGRTGFRRKRNIGELTVCFVDKALKNLYNINCW